MKLIVDLEKEHQIIEKFTGSFLYVCQNEDFALEETWSLSKRFLKLCIDFEHNLHHGKEEKILIPTFEKIQIDVNSKPLFYLKEEHKEVEKLLEKIADTIEKKDKNKLEAFTQELCKQTWKHIDKEDSVIFREASERFRGEIQKELEFALEQYQKEHNEEYQKLWQEAEQLIFKYPPIEDLEDLVRSDGCLVCDHYQNGNCRGIEHEWWNELEWEDFKERNQGD